MLIRFKRFLFFVCMLPLHTSVYPILDGTYIPIYESSTYTFTAYDWAVGTVWFNQGFTLNAGVKARINITPPINPSLITIGSGSQLFFSDGSETTIDGDGTITGTWYFDGATIVHGKGHVLTFGAGGHLVLRPGASLLLDKVTLQGVSGTSNWGSIFCMDNRSTLSLSDVVWCQSADYSFTQGQFYVAGAWDMQGTATFNYATTMTSTIASFGSMTIDKNFTFNYMPATNNRNLLAMQDSTAVFELYGGTLASTTTGIQLSNGTFLCTEKGYLSSSGAIAQSQAITFGNGLAGEDLNIYVEGTLELVSGQLVYNNLEVPAGYAWLTLSGGDVYYRQGITMFNPTGTSWVLVSTTPAMSAIATGYNGVTWAEGADGYLYQRTGTSIANPMGTGWIQDPLGFQWGNPGFTPTLSVGVNGTLWAIGSDGNTYFRNNSSWTQVPQPYPNNHATSVGPNGYLFELVDSYDHFEILYRTGISSSLLMGSGWGGGHLVYFDLLLIAAGPFNGTSYPLWVINFDTKYIEFLPFALGSFAPLTPNNIQASYISVAADGSVWALSYSDNKTIYFRTGVTQGNPQGTNWQTVSSTGLPGVVVTSIAVGANPPFATTTVANT